MGMSILFIFCPFCLSWVTNKTVVSGGIWALDYDVVGLNHEYGMATVQLYYTKCQLPCW